MNRLLPRDVMEKVATALPPDCRGSVIIIGSLAASYHYFGDDAEAFVQTKDVDCMLSPHIKAVPDGKAVAERLLREHWWPRKDPLWEKPGSADTPTEKLPLVRLHPPGSDAWFIELMVSPPAATEQAVNTHTDPANPGKQYLRLEIAQGHYSLCSFRYLALAEHSPIATRYGIAIARPEMMALANLLHHPAISAETMSGLIEGRSIKRSNKDLGRVLALAYLAMEKNEDSLREWPAQWIAGLQKCFPDEWAALAARAGNGLRELLVSNFDLDEAQHTCANGLLARRRPSTAQLTIAGRRLVQDAIEPLEAKAKQ